MRRHLILAVALATLGVGACIIGPKQDDPAPAKPGENEQLAADAASDTASDTATADPYSDASTSSDSTAPPAPIDAAADSADGSSDAACADGGTRLTAIGPWNETKKCWPTTTHSFECVSALDGGTAFTCFVQISTSERFLASTTHIPSGPDYRKCTDVESTSPYERCE